MKASTRLLVSSCLLVAVTTMTATLTTHAAPKAATVVTDLSDYPPGTQVNVTGTGWLAAEVVALSFTETATTPPGGYTDGPFVFYATADSLGNIANGEFYTDQHDVGVTFTLTAKGSISGRTAQTTFTDSLTSTFEIDGNAATKSSHDWDQVYADYVNKPKVPTAGTASIQFTTDGTPGCIDDAFSNTPKDTWDISTWRWSCHAVTTQKADLLHGFAAAYLESGHTSYGSDHTLLYIGTDRYSSGSNSAISMWILQHPIGVKGDGTFIDKSDKTNTTLESHKDGDLLLQASLGNSPTVDAYKWVGGVLQGPVTLTSTQLTQAINSVAIDVPWAFKDSSGSTKPLAQEFYEVGVDLNEVFQTATPPDFSSFVINSRNSNSQTATLTDFILGGVSTVPDVKVEKVADAPVVNAGSPVGYTVTIRNVGVGDVTVDSLVDQLPAGFANPKDLHWTLDSNPSGAFQLTGNDGSQVLSLVGAKVLSYNSPAPLIAHVTATTSAADLGMLHNEATAVSGQEGKDFIFNNTGTADIYVVPVAQNDSYGTALNTTLVKNAVNGVLANDGTPLTGVSAVLLSQPIPAGCSTSCTQKGTVSLSPDGSFTYVPPSGFVGSVTFTYKDQISTYSSNVATVTITIGNAAPVATDDSYSVAEDTTLITSAAGVLTNDTDADGNTLSVKTPITNGATAQGGKVTVNADGSFSYTPAANFNGSDSFTYQATDGVGFSNTATVTISVSPVNDAPVANNGTLTTSEDTPKDGQLVATDVDKDSLTYSLVNCTSGQPCSSAHGTVTLNASTGAYTYTPDKDSNGSASFTFKANDGSLDSNIATINITVTSVNDAPNAENDIYSVNEDTLLSITLPGVLGNDSDPDGDALTASLIAGTGPSHVASFTLNSNGSFSYQPAANYHGSDSFTYKACDNGATNNQPDPKCTTATVSITVVAVNDAPAAVNDSYSTNEDTQLSIAASGVLGNDSDVDGDALTAALVTGPTHAESFTLNSDGSFSYVPKPNYNGADSFTYNSCDNGTTNGQADPKCTMATVSIAVIAVNDAPVAADDSYSVNEDTLLTIGGKGVLGNDSDPDGDALTAAVIAGSGPSHAASFTLNSDGSFSYKPVADYNGGDSFAYKACDNGTTNNQPDPKCTTATVSITVNPVNDPPAAQDGSLTTPEGLAANGQLLASDIDSTTLTYSLVTAAAHGNVIINPTTGGYSYTPTAHYNGPDSFTFKANDGSLDSNVATITISVTAVNDPPSVSADKAAIIVNEGDTAVNTGTFGDIDSTSVTVTTDFGTIEQIGSAAGTWRWTYKTTDDLGPKVVTITATDGEGATASVKFNLTVLNVAPKIVMSPSTIVLSSGDSFTRPGSFADPGADIWTATVNFGDGSKTLPLTDTAFTLESPAYTTPGFYTVTVTVTDDDGGVGIQSFLVRVGVPPAIDYVPSQTSWSGSLTLSFTGQQTTGYRYLINWGDTSTPENGNSTTGVDGRGTIVGSHAYGPGTYQVFVTVIDPTSGLSDTMTFNVTVQ